MQALLLLAALVPGQEVQPPRTLGAAVATLTVEVGETPAGPGLGRITLVVGVEGPPELEVETVRLEEAVPAWKVRLATSSWFPTPRGSHFTETMDLVQTRPGRLPLPAVRLRVRTGGEWYETTWRDLLGAAAEPPDIERLPPVPPPMWPIVLRWLGGGVGVVLVLALGLFLLRRRPRKAQEPAPDELALARLASLPSPPHLDGREHHARVSAVLREYLDQEFSVPAPRLTTVDLGERLRDLEGLPEDVRDRLSQVLTDCDLVKYAGVVPTAAACEGLRIRAEDLVRALRAEAKPRGTGTTAGKTGTEEGG